MDDRPQRAAGGPRGRATAELEPKPAAPVSATDALLQRVLARQDDTARRLDEIVRRQDELAARQEERLDRIDMTLEALRVLASNQWQALVSV